MKPIHQIFIIGLELFVSFFLLLSILSWLLLYKHVESETRFVSFFNLNLRPIDIRMVLVSLALLLLWCLSSRSWTKSSVRQSSLVLIGSLWAALILQSRLDIRKLHNVFCRKQHFFLRTIATNTDACWLLTCWLLLIGWLELRYLSLILGSLECLLKFTLLLLFLDNWF